MAGFRTRKQLQDDVAISTENKTEPKNVRKIVNQYKIEEIIEVLGDNVVNQIIAAIKQSGVVFPTQAQIKKLILNNSNLSLQLVNHPMYSQLKIAKINSARKTKEEKEYTSTVLKERRKKYIGTLMRKLNPNDFSEVSIEYTSKPDEYKKIGIPSINKIVKQRKYERLMVDDTLNSDTKRRMTDLLFGKDPAK